MICIKLHSNVLFQFFRNVSIPVTKEGMGFQIRGSNPCVVHAVAKGGMAMNHGLVKGHAILKVIFTVTILLIQKKTID